MGCKLGSPPEWGRRGYLPVLPIQPPGQSRSDKADRRCDMSAEHLGRSCCCPDPGGRSPDAHTGPPVQEAQRDAGHSTAADHCRALRSWPWGRRPQTVQNPHGPDLLIAYYEIPYEVRIPEAVDKTADFSHLRCKLPCARRTGDQDRFLTVPSHTIS